MNAKTNAKTQPTVNAIEIGQIVRTPKGDGEFVGVTKGWCTVRTAEGDVKVRAADMHVPTEVPTGYVRSGKLIYERARYKAHDVRTASKRRAFDTDDKVAKRLRGLDLDAAYAAAAEWTDTPEKDLRAKYAHLNPGMQRMNLGNKMRAA